MGVADPEEVRRLQLQSDQENRQRIANRVNETLQRLLDTRAPATTADVEALISRFRDSTDALESPPPAGDDDA